MAQVFRSEHFSQYSVQFSPFPNARIAVATAQYYGIVGNGKQVVLQQQPNGALGLLREFSTNDAVLDTCWSESNPEQLVSACGDGTVKLWDLRAGDGFPIQNWPSFTQEVSSVDWNVKSKRHFLAASHSGDVFLFDPINGAPLSSFREQSTVYSVRWNPHFDTSFMICSGTSFVRIFDSRTSQTVLSIQASNGETLACDWNKYLNFQLATAGATSDPAIKLWDVRNPSMPTHNFQGPVAHRFGVRDMKFSPHDGNSLASCSYDMTVRLWNLNSGEAKIFNHHNEFVFGVDFNLFKPGQLASGSWDEHTCVFDINSQVPPKINKLPPKNRRAIK